MWVFLLKDQEGRMGQIKENPRDLKTLTGKAKYSIIRDNDGDGDGDNGVDDDLDDLDDRKE